tara:strand:+ start:127 stop:363 length:237 start_codon:yes stop_codon:yes gene_type:complete
MSEDTDTVAVRVSMREIYVEVQKQGKLLEKIANSLPDSENKIDDHENRIRKLETRIGWAVGSFGLLAALSPFLVRLMP